MAGFNEAAAKLNSDDLNFINSHSGALPPRLLISAALSIADGDIIHWGTGREATEVVSQIKNPDSFLHKFSAGLMINSADRKKALDIILEGLKPYSPLEGDQMADWWWQWLPRNTVNKASIGGGYQVLSTIVEGQTQMAIRLLDEFTLDGLKDYIRFLDQYAFGAELMAADQNPKMPTRTGPFKSVVFEKSPLDTAVEKSWVRLRSNWGWEQVAQATDLLADIVSKDALLAVITSTQQFLTTLPDTEAAEIGDLNLNPQGIARLLEFRWLDNLGSLGRGEHGQTNLELMDQHVERGDLSLPIKYSPTVAIDLILQAARFQSRDSQLDLLRSVSEQVDERRLANSSWTLVLESLRKENPDFREETEALIAGAQGLTSFLIRDILLDRAPGQVYMDKRGELRTDSNSAPDGNPVLVHISTAAARIPNGKSEKLNPAYRPIGDIIVLKQLGEVGLIRETDIEELISLMAVRVPEGFGYEPEDEFSELSNSWAGKNWDSRSLTFISDLNQYYGRARIARKAGVDLTIIQDGRILTFVMNPNVAFSELKKGRIPVAIQGILDSAGQLHISGMPETFIGEETQLGINNIALDLATTEFYPFPEIPEQKETNQKISAEMSEAVRSWNQRRQIKSLRLNGDRSKSVPIYLNKSGVWVLY